MATLDIVIVNWNAGRHLYECVASIAHARRDGFVLDRVVVVDNASTDGSLDALEGLDLPLTILRNPANRGFAAGCNQGAAGSRADYLLFLNPDTRLFAGSLAAPIAFMEGPASAGVGICGIRLVDDQGRMTTSCARFPTLRVIFGETTRLSSRFPARFPPHLLTEAECRTDQEVDQIIGAFFLVRRALFEALDGFDERFFVYYEEVDFSLRARARGYRSYYLSGPTAFHEGGGTSRNVKALRLFYLLRSRILYGLKHYSRRDALLLVAAVGFVELPGRLLQALLRRSWAQCRETLHAYRLLATHFARSDRHG